MGKRSLAGSLGLIALSCSAPARAPAPVRASGDRPVVTHGVAAGDVTTNRAVIWARADRFALLHVALTGEPKRRVETVWVSEATDFAGKVVLEGLEPGRTYRYQVWFTVAEDAAPPPAGAAAEGRFRTAPESTADAPITFGWSGDLAGLDVCRDAERGFPVFDGIHGEELDFFLGLGDMIYADFACEPKGHYGNAQVARAVGIATTLREYWAHWEYTREDPGLRRLLASTAYVAMWDDHEVVNDFAPGEAWHRYPPYTIGADLVQIGLRAFLDQNPVLDESATPGRIYRSFRWGKRLEMFVLDTRSYRDPDPLPDSPDHPKTLLGKAQLDWFRGGLARSDAVWKIVVSSVPISIPTGRGGAAGRDGWANHDTDTGYETELRGIFESLLDASVTNVLFITTDVHFATGFTYRPFPESPGFVVHELTAGPLGAVLLPTAEYDDTFHPERLFLFGPEKPPASFAEAARFMNWGKITIDGGGTLRATIVDGLGAPAASVAFPALPSGGAR